MEHFDKVVLLQPKKDTWKGNLELWTSSQTIKRVKPNCIELDPRLQLTSVLPFEVPGSYLSIARGRKWSLTVIK